MVQFALPEKSKVKKGKHFAASGAKRPRTFKVYRWDPTKNAIVSIGGWSRLDIK